MQPARRIEKTGQLRIAFRELTPPNGIQQEVEATLAAVQAGKNANVIRQATNSKSRYAD
ncbi:MAG TPA: hypothetical protein VEI01_11285 [Terriglobales bacterium]|nr:hypothetical protein [Terriglobales bacterium]